jgi:hypothetical protein
MALESQQGEQLTFVVYDASTGEVRHVHYVAVLPGAQPPPREESEKRALAVAGRFGRGDSLQLKVLHIGYEVMKPQFKHRVDLKNLKVISEPIKTKESKS